MPSYPVNLEEDTNDTLLVTSPDFPELTTFGEDTDDALAYAADALLEAILARIAHGEEIPDPSKHDGPFVPLPEVAATELLRYRMQRHARMRAAERVWGVNGEDHAGNSYLTSRHARRLEQLERASASSNSLAAVGALGA